MNKTAIIYCRVSTKKQEKYGESLDNQITECEKYCKNNNINIFGIFKEAFTGKITNRPIFKQAIDNAILNKVNYFIIYDIDRFTREGYGAYSDLKNKLENNGILLRDSKNIISESNIVYKNDLVDTSKYTWNIENKSEYAELIYSTQAHIEGRKIIQRTIPAEIRLEQEGYHVRAPNYGYMNKKVRSNEDKKKNIQIKHPEQGEYVIYMFKERAKGELSDKKIVENVNLMGAKKKNDKPMDTKYMQELIKNPIYCGILKTKWTGYKPIRTSYEGLVDIETWNLANRGKIEIKEKKGVIEIIYKNTKIDETSVNTPIIEKRKNYNPEFPFSKVLKCPICGKLLKTNNSRSGDKKTIHKYYQCVGIRDKKHKTYTLKREFVNETIENNILTLKPTKELIKLFDEISNKVFEERKNELKKIDIGIEQQIKDLEKKEKQIINTLDNYINLPNILELKNKELEDIKNSKKELEENRGKGKKLSSLEQFKKNSKKIITHIDKIALQKEKPELINLAFKIIYGGVIEFEKIKEHTHYTRVFSSNLSQQKNPPEEDLDDYRKWQSH